MHRRSTDPWLARGGAQRSRQVTTEISKNEGKLWDARSWSHPFRSALEDPGDILFPILMASKTLFPRPPLRNLERLLLGSAIVIALDGCGQPLDSGPCPEGFTSCGTCVDVSTDIMNCGTCGNVCGSGEDCQNSVCVCSEGQECGGVCVNTKADPANCGACGVPCGAGLVCSNSSCKAECDPNLEQCGFSCVDRQTDTSHCGQCGEICESGQRCAQGLCTCAPGRQNCGSGCTDVSTDLLHCGQCESACGDGLVCQSGQCQPAGAGVGGAPGVGGSGSGGILGSGGDNVGGLPGSGGQTTGTGGLLATGGSSVGGGAAGGAPGSGGGGGQGCSGKTGFYVENAKLYDKNCNEFIMRGVNYPYAWYSSRSLASEMSAMASVGSNVVRIVAATGDRWTRTSGATLTSIINAAKAEKLIVVMEVHDTTGYAEQSGSVPLSNAISYWTSSDVASALKGQEAYVIINIGNEPNGNDTSPNAPSRPDTWAQSHMTAVQTLRGAGFHHALMVDAPNWGQDWGNTMRDGGGTRIWDADSEKNIVFSVHMYDEFNSSQKISTYFNTFLEKYDAPLVVGEFAADHGAGKEVDEGAIMMFAESLGIGYMGWSWSGNGDGLGSLDITTNFNVGQLSAWGNTLVNGANGLKATSEICSVFE